jgi:serine/threonine protein kinase
VLLYELSTGRAPFESYDPTGTAKKVLKGLVDFPDTITGPMKDLIKALLTKDRTRRLGVLKGGTEDVMKHRFYWGFSWEGLLNKKAVPPFKPELPENFDTLGQPDSDDDENVKAVPTWSPDF